MLEPPLAPLRGCDKFSSDKTVCDNNQDGLVDSRAMALPNTSSLTAALNVGLSSCFVACEFLSHM